MKKTLYIKLSVLFSVLVFSFVFLVIGVSAATRTSNDNTNSLNVAQTPTIASSTAPVTTPTNLPSISYITPVSSAAGAEKPVWVYGLNFKSNSDILIDGSRDIVPQQRFIDQGMLLFYIPTDLGAGSHAIQVLTQDTVKSRSISNSVTLELTSPAASPSAPIISRITPTSIAVNQGSSMWVYGSNFDLDHSYIIIDNFIRLIPKTYPEQIGLLTFTAPSDLSVGSHSVQVGTATRSPSETNTTSILLLSNSVPLQVGAAAPTSTPASAVINQTGYLQSASNQELQKQLIQLTNTLVQLLKQAAAQGILSQDQVNSFLHGISIQGVSQ